MAKPKSSNRSIRLTDEMWARLNAEADRRQNSVNGLVAALLEVALLKLAERDAGAVSSNSQQITNPLARKPKPAGNGGAEPAPANPPKPALSIPFAGDITKRPMQKGAKK